MEERTIEFSSCNIWFDCKFILRMKKGKEVKIFISMLDQDKEFTCLKISEDITAIRLLLNSFQMDREPSGKYCLYEERLPRGYQRGLGRKEKVLQVQKRWEEDMEVANSFSFRLKLNLEMFNNRLY